MLVIEDGCLVVNPGLVDRADRVEKGKEKEREREQERKEEDR